MNWTDKLKVTLNMNLYKYHVKSTWDVYCINIYIYIDICLVKTLCQSQKD